MERGAGVQVPGDAQIRGLKSIDSGTLRSVTAVIRVYWTGCRRRVHTRFYVTGRNTNYEDVAIARASVRDRRFRMRPAYKRCYCRPTVIVPTRRLKALRILF